MKQVTPLTPGGQVLGIIVREVVVEVARGKTHECPPKPIGLEGPSHAEATPVALGVVLTVEPSSVADAQHDFAVRSATTFAAAFGATEADRR